MFPATLSAQYHLVTSGTSCVRVTSKDECEAAARMLGLSDTTAIVDYVYKWPPYCLHSNGLLYYNTRAYESTTECSSSYKCICKGTVHSLSLGRDRHYFTVPTTTVVPKQSRSNNNKFTRQTVLLLICLALVLDQQKIVIFIYELITNNKKNEHCFAFV